MTSDNHDYERVRSSAIAGGLAQKICDTMVAYCTEGMDVQEAAAITAVAAMHFLQANGFENGALLATLQDPHNHFNNMDDVKKTLTKVPIRDKNDKLN